MKNKIIVCFMSLLGFASCSDSSEELGDTAFSNDQTSVSGDYWVAVLIDGLCTKWNAGDTILLLQNGQTIFAEAQQSGNIASFSSDMKGSFVEGNSMASIRQATGCLTTMRASPYLSLPFR